jgi:small-conductance mechanosensitive channel
LEWVVQAYAHAGLMLFVVSGLANVLGYVHLSTLLGGATFSSSYLAIILYAAVRILDAVILSVLEVPTLLRLTLIRRHQALLAQVLFRLVRWVAALFWLWRTLDLFSLRGLLWTNATAILATKIGWDTHTLMIGDLLAFGVTVWASFFLSKIIRVILEEEIFLHLHLPPGIPYTASTLVHYLVLLLGFFVALEFLGIQLSNFAVLAGAFGVGLGFGLQNIMNNFVSGVILLFERPIKVGDIIQVDTALGTVESIGIRASIIRLTNGSEVIVPNGNLISNPVTNWTLSNRQRMIDLPVTVAAKTDPKQVLALLMATALDHPLVLKQPAPQALVTNFTAAALSLELRVWTNNPNEWVQIRSDLSVAITGALAKENIAIA